MRTTKIRRRIVTIGATVALVAIPIAAFAGSIFNDVDDNSTHIEGITWVKNSGVSVGCDNNGNYCPSDNVTREQMGTFMYRLSGNDQATPPSVNADKLDGIDSAGFLGATAKAADSDLLDGQDSNEILPIMFGQSYSVGSSTLHTSSGLVEVNSRTFAVPDNGYLVISGTVYVGSTEGSTRTYQVVPKVDGANAVTPGWAGFFIAGATGTSASSFTLPYTVVVPITQGIHTVSQEVGPFGGTATFYTNQQNLVVVFYPEGQGFINQTP